jgi:hypothetical protein
LKNKSGKKVSFLPGAQVSCLPKARQRRQGQRLKINLITQAGLFCKQNLI